MQITKDFEIDIAHRILRHETKCKNVHGHRIKIRVHATANKLDSVGRIVDFGVIKEVIGGWLNDNLDHGFVSNPRDQLISFLENEKTKHFVMRFAATDQMFSIMKSKSVDAIARGETWCRRIEELYEEDAAFPEPTSENLARMVLEECVLLSRSNSKLSGIDVTEIECYETPTASASFTKSDLLRVWGHYSKFQPVNKASAPWHDAFLVMTEGPQNQAPSDDDQINSFNK
jgi:6-pyruvoyl tetrahydropterin synthase/QueD family protein